MTPSRRTLLGGLIATLAAPAIIRTPGLLMPVRVVRPVLTMDIIARETLKQYRNALRGAQIYGRAFVHVNSTGIVRIVTPAEFAASGRTA